METSLKHGDKKEILRFILKIKRPQKNTAEMGLDLLLQRPTV